MAADAPARRIVFVNRFFYPDESATAQILTDLATHLAASGWDVTVVSSRPRRGQSEPPRLSVLAQVEVKPVLSTHLGGRSHVGKLLDYASFYAGALIVLWRTVRAGDLVVAKTDPPLISVAAMLVSARKRATQVNWLQDLYPEVAQQLGAPLVSGVPGRMLTALRNRSLRGAACNVVIGKLMGERLEAHCVPPQQIACIANWADEQAIRPHATSGASFRQRLGYSDSEFVVGYSGNLGRAHEAETLLGAAKLLQDHPAVRFLMIGGGAQNALLRRRAGDLGLSNIRFVDHQPRDALAETLGAADVHWISLRPELEGLIVPSKFYGILAAGRPVIAVACTDGEVAREIDSIDCGLSVEPGDASGFAAAILQLVKNPALGAEMGGRARAASEERLSKRRALQQWEKLLDRLQRGT